MEAAAHTLPPLPETTGRAVELHLLTGRREAWDAAAYWTMAYPAGIVVSAVLGYLATDRAWRWGLVLMLAQAVTLAVLARDFGLLPLGLVLFGVLALPPYAPELNPQEHVWDELREKEFPNRVFDSMDRVREQLEAGLPRLAADRKTLRSLTAWPWIHSLILNAH